jgi:hypothetical protein
VGVGHKLEKMYTFSLIYAPPPPSYMRVGVGHKLEKMYKYIFSNLCPTPTLIYEGGGGA